MSRRLITILIVGQVLIDLAIAFNFTPIDIAGVWSASRNDAIKCDNGEGQ